MILDVAVTGQALVRWPLSRPADDRVYEVPILLGEQTAGLAARRYRVVEIDRITVRGRTEPTRISTVAPEADDEALAIHAAVLEDFLAGRLKPSDERLDWLAARMPSLAGYYGKLRGRLAS